MNEAAGKREDRVEELERQLTGLRSRLEKLGGEVVRADYKVLHLTQEVRRSREAFEFLTGFQNNISRARSIQVLYRIALKSIIAELWITVGTGRRMIDLGLARNLPEFFALATWIVIISAGLTQLLLMFQKWITPWAVEFTLDNCAWETLGEIISSRALLNFLHCFLSGFFSENYGC